MRDMTGEELERLFGRVLVYIAALSLLNPILTSLRHRRIRKRLEHVDSSEPQ